MNYLMRLCLATAALLLCFPAASHASPYYSGTVIEGDGSSTSGGTLQIGDGGTVGALGTGQIQFALAAGQTTDSTRDFDRADAITVASSVNVSNSVGAIIEQSGSNTLTLSGPETISNATADLTYLIGSTGESVDTALSGAISGSGSIIKSGPGTLSFSGSDTYLGSTTVSAGTLIISGSGQLGGGIYGGNLSIANDATFAYNSGMAQTVTGLISGSGSLASGECGAVSPDR
jgi:autotransporter-associated beta strand protein